jgi:hypothetical protein
MADCLLFPIYEAVVAEEEESLYTHSRIVIMDALQTVFEAAGGIAGLRRLADAWHRRVMADDVVAHAFSHGFHPHHVVRLAACWAEALGGPGHVFRFLR